MKSPIGAAPLFMSMVVAAWTAVAGQQRRAGPPQAHESSARASVQYKSPDESAVALVFPAGKRGHESHESRVEVRSKSGRLLAQHEYSSGDGEHGYGVAKAAWTPDSGFFVYSLENSGGQQPWHSPVEFYSRAAGRIFSLDDALHDAVANAQFSVAAPDRVTVVLWFSKTTRTVSLSALVVKE